MKINFPFSNAKLLLMIYQLDRKYVTMKELADLLGMTVSNLSPFKDFLIKEKILNYKEDVTIKNDEGTFHVKLFEIDFERMDVIFFSKWDSKILFDRAHLWITRPMDSKE